MQQKTLAKPIHVTGLQPRRIQMQAVFFGEGYRADLDKLVNVLQKQGADVLVHPILHDTHKAAYVLV